jgi:hypothetical protein
VDERTLGVHKIELVVETGEDLSDSGRVGDHAASALDLGQITTGNDGRGLVVDTALEAGGRPVHELNGTLGLDGSNSGVDILGDDITTVHKADSHVLTVSRVALNHGTSGLESGVGDLGNGKLLVVGLLSRDDGSVRRKHKVDTRVRDQVGLKLGDINVKSTIESQGSGERGDDLGNEPVKIGVGRALDVKRAAANIVDGFVVKHDGDIGVLKKRMSRQDGVVWLDDSGGDPRRTKDGKTEFGLLAVVDGQTLEEERSESGTGTTADGVEDHESLQTSAVIGQLANAVEGEVDNLLTDGVVTTGVVVGSIFLTGDQLVRVEELTVGTGAALVDGGGLKVEEDRARDVLASTSLREEGVESVVATANGFVGRHLTIGLNAVLEAVELPAGVTDLNTGLTEVDRDDFAHIEC